MKAADERGRGAILAREKDDEVRVGANTDGGRKRPLRGKRPRRIVSECEAADVDRERRRVEELDPRGSVRV